MSGRILFHTDNIGPRPLGQYPSIRTDISEMKNIGAIRADLYELILIVIVLDKKIL